MSDSKKYVPRLVSVSPKVLDPSMKNTKNDTEGMLGEYADEHELKDHIFDKKFKTQEEKSITETGTGDNTVLIIVFAVIVVALVAMIIWLFMKQSSDVAAQEEEMRRMISPHIDNRMPPYPRENKRPVAHAIPNNTVLPNVPNTLPSTVPNVPTTVHTPQSNTLQSNTLQSTTLQSNTLSNVPTNYNGNSDDNAVSVVGNMNDIVASIPKKEDNKMNLENNELSIRENDMDVKLLKNFSLPEGETEDADNE